MPQASIDPFLDRESVFVHATVNGRQVVIGSVERMTHQPFWEALDKLGHVCGHASEKSDAIALVRANWEIETP